MASHPFLTQLLREVRTQDTGRVAKIPHPQGKTRVHLRRGEESVQTEEENILELQPGEARSGSAAGEKDDRPSTLGAGLGVAASLARTGELGGVADGERGHKLAGREAGFIVET
jgi:hypothetical protein